MFSLRDSFPHEFPQIIYFPITETEVIRTVSSLKSKTSCGYDGLSNKILKLCGSQISKLLLILRCLCIALIARKLSKPDDGHYRTKHVVFHC